MSKNYQVKINDIENSSGGVLEFDFSDEISEIKSKGYFTAKLSFQNLGDFIKVQGELSGVAILDCDLCLEEYEHNVNIQIDEMFSKKTLIEEYSQETELKEDQFVIDLEGKNFIDIYDLLYQSVIIDFPNKKVCGINCKGGDIFIRDESLTNDEVDPRMSVFKNIKINGKQ